MSSPVTNVLVDQERSIFKKRNDIQFAFYSHSDTADMERSQSKDQSSRGILKRASSFISRLKLQKNVKAFVKCLAFGLMLCSVKPNMATAKLFSRKSVPQEKTSTLVKKDTSVVKTAIISGMVGVGAIQVIRKKSDIDFSEKLEEQRIRFNKLIGITKDKSDIVTDVDEEILKDDIKEALQKDKDEDARIKRKLELEAKQAELVKKMVQDAEKREEEAKAKAEEEAKMKAMEEQKAEEEAKIKAMDEQKAEEEAKIKVMEDEKAKEEAKLKAMEDEKAKEEAKMKAMEEKRVKATEEKRSKKEAKKRAIEAKKEEEAKIRAIAEQQARQEQEEEMNNRRKQPKSSNVEKLLATKYNSIQDLEEKAFTILADLKMITKTPDPKDPSYDKSQDDEIASENIFLK